MTQAISFINHSFSEITDSLSTICKNGMFTSPCQLRSSNFYNATSLKV